MITIEDIDWAIVCHPEDTPIEGNVLASGDDEEDRKAEQSVKDQLAMGNDWAWCGVEVRGSLAGITLNDYLGCCSYASREDFTVSSNDYYDDMRQSIVDQFNATKDALNNV